VNAGAIEAQYDRVEYIVLKTARFLLQPVMPDRYSGPRSSGDLLADPLFRKMPHDIIPA
tara:strand:+ start:20212 stop:20388 length:177 start_codon:yes stop_codon:yes gene_type:complete